MNRALLSTAFLGAASVVATALAQGVPTPPPAGVVRPRARIVPAEQQPAAETKAAEPEGLPQAQPEALPQLPENPIKLEEKLQPDVYLQPSQMPAAAPVVSQHPVKAVGPVYYFAPGPHAYPAAVISPAAVHVPNSPFVEELSVAGDHGRYTYYSYRRPWYTPGQLSANVTIVW